MFDWWRNLIILNCLKQYCISISRPHILIEKYVLKSPVYDVVKRQAWVWQRVWREWWAWGAVRPVGLEREALAALPYHSCYVFASQWMIVPYLPVSLICTYIPIYIHIMMAIKIYMYTYMYISIHTHCMYQLEYINIHISISIYRVDTASIHNKRGTTHGERLLRMKTKRKMIIVKGEQRAN